MVASVWKTNLKWAVPVTSLWYMWVQKGFFWVTLFRGHVCLFYFFHFKYTCFLEGNRGLRLIVIRHFGDPGSGSVKQAWSLFPEKFSCPELMFVPSTWVSYGSIDSRCYGRTGCLTRSLNVCFRWRTPKTMRKTSCKEKSHSGSPVGDTGRSTRGESVRPSRTMWIPAATCRWVCSPLAHLLAIVMSAWLARIFFWWQNWWSEIVHACSFWEHFFHVEGQWSGLDWNIIGGCEGHKWKRWGFFWFRDLQLSTINKS